MKAIMTKARWILPIALWAILSFCSYNFLFKVEERSLFVFDLFWLKDFLYKPSGILSCISLFFTQFLHIPWLGAMIWVILLTASAELTRIVYKIPSSLCALTYIPAAIFVSYNMSMGYMVYIMNCPGYFFLPVLGYLWALLTVVLNRKCQQSYTSLLFVVIWGLAGYYIAGFYGLAAIVAAGVDMIASDYLHGKRIIPLTGLVFVVLMAPILFFGTTTYYLPKGWTIGLPDHIHSVSLSRMQLPVIIALLFLLIAPLARFTGKLSAKTILYIQSISLAAVIAIPAASWYKDSNFKAELKMIQAADNLEWNKIPQLFDKYSDKHENDPSWQPTRVMVVLKDLALIKTGQEGEQAFAFEDGSKQQKRKWEVPMSVQIGRILGLQYGIPGLCQRWCYEESVLFGLSNATYKYNTMTAILFGDTKLTEKYLKTLDHTLFYHKWAKEQRRIYIDRELLANTAPYDLILPLMCYDDIVCSDLEGCEMFLNRHFNGASPEKSTPLYDRVALYFAMKSKDATLFWTRFFLYLDSNNPEKIDRYYQEAAYMYSNIGNKDLLEVLPFDEKVKSLYKSFSSLAEKYGPKSMDDSRLLFPAHLRHTYYYYYYYVNNIKLF